MGVISSPDTDCTKHNSEGGWELGGPHQRGQGLGSEDRFSHSLLHQAGQGTLGLTSHPDTERFIIPGQ